MLAVVSQLLHGDVSTSATAHLAKEVVCLLTTVSILYWSLRDSDPTEKGLFSFSDAGIWTLHTVVVALFMFPMVDPVLSTAWTAITQGLLPESSSTSIALALQDAAAHRDLTTIIQHALATCCIGPLWEEVYWRGFFLPSVAKVILAPTSIIVSSTLFAALHLSLANALPIFLLSCACDTLYLRSRTLAPPLLLHVMWNTYQFVAVTFFDKAAFV